MNTFIFIIKKKKKSAKQMLEGRDFFVCLFWNMFCSVKENRTKDIQYSEIFFFFGNWVKYIGPKIIRIDPTQIQAQY